VSASQNRQDSAIFHTLSGGNDKAKEGPGSGVDRASKFIQKPEIRSGRLRCLLLGYALCLRAFLSLDNFEFDIIAFLQTLVAV